MSIRTAPGEKRGVRTTFRAGSPHPLFYSRLASILIVSGFALGALFCTASFAQDAAQEGEQGTGLDTLVEDLNVQGDNIRELVELLATFGETNINVVGTVPQTPVNVILKNKTIREILEELAVQYQLYIDYQPGNTLIRPLTEKPQEQVQVIERDFRLNFSRPSDVEPLVTPLLSNRPEAAIQAIDNLKTIRVSDIPEAVARIEAFINMVDLPQQSHVFRIMYANVEDVAAILFERLPDLEETAITVDVANSQLIVRTTLENLNEIQLLIETLDIKKEIRVFHINFHEVEEVIAILEDLALLSPEATIAPNEFTGKIIIQDTPERLDRIADAIRAYDQPRPMVFFEAEILDVNADYNFNWNPNLDLLDSARQITADATDDITVLRDGETKLEVSGDGAFAFGHLEAGDYLATLQTMESDSDVRSIASPRILVQMREQARLNVGSEEPYGVRSFRSTVTGVGSDFVTQRVREVGVRLIIEVRNISEQGYVDVLLGMENSALGGRVDIGGDTLGLRVLTTNVETVAMIKDGRTLAVGGLVQRMESETSGGPPFLSKVPVVRYLVSNLTKQDTRRKLLLFITPHILNIDLPLDKYKDRGGEDYTVLGEDNFDLAKVNTASFVDTPKGGSDWVNRGGRWGFLDEDGNFVDRNDLFMSAYAEESTPAESADAMEDAGGPSAKELLDQLEAMDSGVPVKTEPPTLPNGSEQPERIQVDPGNVQPATPRPVQPKEGDSSAARPRQVQALVGQEAMDALNSSANGLGEFEGSLKELLQKVQQETGVNPGVGNVEDHDLPVRANGAGKTYLEVLREALAPHGMMIQRRENRPPGIRPVPTNPEKAPAAPLPAPAPGPADPSQSRVYDDPDPWGYAESQRLSRGSSIGSTPKNLSIEEWVALGQGADSAVRTGAPSAPPSTESWEVPIEVDSPSEVDVYGYRSEFQSSGAGRMNWDSPSSMTRTAWDDLVSEPALNMGFDEPTPLPLNRHVKQAEQRPAPAAVQPPPHPVQGNQVSMRGPIEPPAPEKKEGRVRKFVGRLLGKD